jgi:hypothetical protein
MPKKHLLHLTFSAFLIVSLFACKSTKNLEAQKNKEKLEQHSVESKTDNTNSDANVEPAQQTSTSGTLKTVKVSTLPVATYEHDASNMISKIHFINSPIVFDVYENNPFNNLNCGKIYKKTKNYGNCYGSIKGKQIKDFVKNFLALPYNPKIKETDPVDSIANDGYVGYSYNQKWHYISYTTQIYSNFQWSASNSIIIFLDSLGTKITEINISGLNIITDQITEDGKYFILNYGIDSENENILKMGYKIYNVETRKILVDDNVEQDSRAYILNNLIIVNKEYFTGNIEFTDLLIFDLYRGVKYSGTF